MSKSQKSQSLSIKCVGECWFWQLRKLWKLKKETRGWLGFYDWYWSAISDVRLKGTIKYIKVKPSWIWKNVLKHELGHHQVLDGICDQEEPKRRTLLYDKKTLHGLLQARAEQLPFWEKGRVHVLLRDALIDRLRDEVLATLALGKGAVKVDGVIVRKGITHVYAGQVIEIAVVLESHVESTLTINIG